MRRRRVWLAAGTCCAAALVLLVCHWFPVRTHAFPIGETVVVGVRGQPLSSLFEGVAPNRTNDLGRLKPPSARPCEVGAVSRLFRGLLHFFEVNAHAQGGGYTSSCLGDGFKYENANPACGGLCTGANNQVDQYGSDSTQSDLFDGTTVCSGGGAGCGDPPCTAGNTENCGMRQCTYCIDASQCPSGQGCANHTCGSC